MALMERHGISERNMPTMFKTQLTEHFASELFSSDTSPFFDDHGDAQDFDPAAFCDPCGEVGCNPGRRELADRMQEIAMDTPEGFKRAWLELKTEDAILALWQACYYNEDKWQEWFSSGDRSAGAFVRVARRIMNEIDTKHPDVIERYRKLVASW